MEANRLRAIIIFLLFAAPVFGQSQYQYFVAPNTVTQHTRDTLVGKNYAALMHVAGHDTIDISAGWNTGQPFTFYAIADTAIPLVWGTTITAPAPFVQLDSGVTYKFVFTYQNSSWRLDLDPLWAQHYSAGTFWQYRTKTTVLFGYPGDGNLSWNNTTQISATKIAISHLTDDGLDIHILLSKLTVGNQILIQDQDAAGNFQAWHISGTPTDSSTTGDYWTFPVTLDSSGGTGTTNFANNHPITVITPSTGGGSGTVTSFSTSLAGLSVATATTTPALSGTLAETSGGTNQTSYTTGDMLYASGTNVLSKLPIGSENYYMKSVSGVPSWQPGNSAGTTSTAIIDMSSPASQIVKDTLLGTAQLIHVSSKPSIPQFGYVVRAADIPTNTVATSYMAVLTIGGKNRHTASAVTVNWVACRGMNPATEFAAGSSTSVSATQFWDMSAFFDSKGVSVGDTLSIKIWSSTIDTSDFRYATIYFIPRLISPPSGQFYFYGQTNTSNSVPWDYATVLAGANAGVSYQSISNQPTMFLLDSATSSAFIQPIMTQTMPQLVFMIGTGQYMGFGPSSTLSDVDNISATNAVAILNQLASSNGTARRIRYLRKWTIGIN